tara:strand:- start:77 stop:487 length:411 start_codon:yes stop_codon:yes gene_type:complete
MTTASPEYLRADTQLRRARTALRAAIRRHVRGTLGEQNAVLNLVQPVINAASYRSMVTRRSAPSNFERPPLDDMVNALAGLDPSAVAGLIEATRVLLGYAEYRRDEGKLAPTEHIKIARAALAKLDALAPIWEPVL